MLIGLVVSTLSCAAPRRFVVALACLSGCRARVRGGHRAGPPMATLVLEAVNQLSGTAASTVAAHESALGTSLVGLAPSTPGFAVFLLSVVVVIGTMLLWFELIVRTVVLTLLLVLVPVIVPLATFPSMRRLGWRLAETFVAVAASKLAIVITLSLGLDELDGHLGDRDRHWCGDDAAGDSDALPGASRRAAARTVGAAQLRGSTQPRGAQRGGSERIPRGSGPQCPDAERTHSDPADEGPGPGSGYVARIRRVADAAPRSRRTTTQTTHRHAADSKGPRGRASRRHGTRHRVALG